MRYPHFLFRLPPWIEAALPAPETPFPTVTDRMRLVIELSRANYLHGTGGPFAAAIFDMRTQQLLAPGVNLVLSENCSILHAEMVAIMLAQRLTHTFDLGSEGLAPYELVASAEPCAMCMGAIPWSGVRRLVCGARDRDIRRVGFDEGAKSGQWIQAMESRGIIVVQDILREEAAAVIMDYHKAGGIIYNGRQGRMV